MSFAVRTRVRYQETDQMGVVYHSNYFIYFELARTEMMRAAGVAYSQLEREGTLLAVTRGEIDLLSSASYDDMLRIEVRFSGARKASFRLDYEIHDEQTGVLRARGMTELARLDANRRPRRLDAEFVRLLREAPARGVDLL